MESRLTQSEMDAVLQLIQLSRNSALDFHVFWVNFPGGKREFREETREEEDREESVGETSSYSSGVMNPEKLSEEEEALPRRRKKLRRIVDIYKETQPSIKTSRRGHKRPKI